MRRFTRFVRDDDRGSTTLWNLFWLTGFSALLGLGIDTTAAMNAMTRLQAAADAASHAAAMDIFPVADAAVDTAVDYARKNMPDQPAAVGVDDVTLGYWDPVAQTFQTEAPRYINAVRVIARRDSVRGNALGTFLLKVTGFTHWDIAAASTSTYFNDVSLVNRCRLNGFLAGGDMELTSNNIIEGDLCAHGQNSIKINSNNVITCGALLSAPGPSAWKTGTPPSGTVPAECNTDYGSLSNDQMIEQATVYSSVPSRAELEYENVRAMLDAFVAGETVNDPFNAIPPYITGFSIVDPNAFNNTAKQGKLVAGTLYVVSCDGTNKKLQPEGIIRNVGIYTDCLVDVQKDRKVSNEKPTKVTGNYSTASLCDPDDFTCDTVPWDSEIPYDYDCAEAIAAGFESYTTLLDTAPGETYRDGTTVDGEAQSCGLEPGANGLWDNVFLFTTAYEDGDRSQKAVNFPNNMQIGRLDGCAEGGAVRLYAGGSIATPSGTMIHGSHFILLGDAKLAAKGSGTQGATVEAAGNIQFSAQGKVGGCPAREDSLESDVVITVRPIAIVN